MIRTWDKSFETGNEMIDRQHRELIDLLDELREAEYNSDVDVLRMLDKVMEFALQHFIAEEELMAEVGYPAADKDMMVKQHQKFKSYARQRVLDFRRGKGLSVPELQVYLEEFLKVHEFGLDKQLADWIRHWNEIS